MEKGTVSTGVFIVILLLFSSLHCSSSDFQQLLKEKKIQCSVFGFDGNVHYGKALQIHFANLTNGNIRFSVPCGFIFKPEDTIYQDIIVTQTLYVDMQEGQTRDYKLYGMCMEEYDRAPCIHSIYQPFKMAEDGLLKLVHFIEQNRFFSPAGQNAVWTYIQDKPLYSVASIDTAQAFKLQKFLADITGKPVLEISEEDEYVYDYHRRPKKFIVEGEVNFKYDKPIKVEWCLFNEQGVLVREIYNGEIAAGPQTLSFSYDATVYSDPVYYIKLVMNGEVIYNSKLTFDD
jgi:hypothetical protein